MEKLVDFTKEEMHAELRELLFGFIRIVCYGAGPVRAWQLIGRPAPASTADLWRVADPDSTASDLEFDTRQWPVATVFDKLYDFGVMGIARDPIDSMGDESEFTYCAALVVDLSRSSLLHEFHGSGGTAPGAKRCLHVAQLSAARVVLEGGERFFIFGDDGYTDLTIRDMALLARMEETSVRNAANPKRPNALQTYQVDGRTSINPEEAKRWLSNRGKYLKVSRQYDAGVLDLRKEKFRSTLDADEFLRARLALLEINENELVARVAAKDFTVQSLLDDQWTALPAATLARIADALSVDARIFSLRVRELRISDEARQISRELAGLDRASRQSL